NDATDLIAIAGSVESPIPAVPRLSMRKVRFRIPAAKTDKSGPHKCAIQVVRKGAREKVLDSAAIELRLRRPEESHKRTFISDIDGSVQYYAVQPARRTPF